MARHAYFLLMLALIACVAGNKRSNCSILARTESGLVCGTQRKAQNGKPYASFRGIPYAKQPLGNLRFKELQPAEPWDHTLNASTEGPACYQHNVFFLNLMKPQGFSESCIHTNVHVPLNALPSTKQKVKTSGGRPIFVFYHGGGWISGSGDADVNGPEYLVAKGVIVITFNYRVDFLGFLSLGTSKIPGNNGLRDCVTLLKWVKRNARFFGGDPDNITLAGQSAGANNAHLLSLSPVSKGLFKRLWLMSGTAIPRNFVSSPLYAQQLATSFLTYLGLNGTDNDTVHDKLVQLPIEELHNASSKLLPLGLTTFMPVQETTLPGVTPIIADDPEKLLASGKGDDVPTIAGFNNNECQTFYGRWKELNIVERYKQNPSTAVPPQLLFTLPTNVTTVIAEKIGKRYFNGDPTLEKYITLCSEAFFSLPTLKFVRDRSARGGAPVYLYKFSYDADYGVVKLNFNLTFSGAAHVDDLTYVLKTNSFPLPASRKDDNMRDWISDLVVNFAKTGSPSTDNSWPPQSANQSLQYQEFITPKYFNYVQLSDGDQSFLKFFDEIDSMSK